MKKLIFLMTVLLSVAVSAFNLSISPTGFILPLDRPQNREVTLTNNSSDNMRVEISVEQPGDYKKEHSMNQYVKIYPKVLTMPGNSTKTIRFSAKLPSDMKDGQYKALIVFKEIPDNPTMVVQQQGEMTVNMAMYSEVAIPVYGEKGKLEFTGKLKDIKVSRASGKTNINVILAAGGNTTVRPEYKAEYLNEAGKKIGEGKGTLPRTFRDGESVLSAELQNIPELAKSVKIIVIDNKSKIIGEKILKI